MLLWYKFIEQNRLAHFTKVNDGNNNKNEIKQIKQQEYKSILWFYPHESSFLFAKHGAKVVVADVNTKKGEEVVDTIKKWGGAAIFVHADVSKASDVEKLVQVAEKTYLYININRINA